MTASAEAALVAAVERVLDRLSAAQVEALAARSGAGVPLAPAVVGASPAAHAAVATLAERWAAVPGLTGPGVALALRTAVRARVEADRRRARPVWTGPAAVGEQRLTGAVLHELLVGVRERILLVSYAAYTLPAVAADLEQAAAAGCVVDVVFETEADSAGAYMGHEARPFSEVAGIRRWRWPPAQRSGGAVLHAKLLIVDGRRALIGSANLTRRALEHNLEAGILLRDAAVAAALERHVRGLMDADILLRDAP